MLVDLFCATCFSTEPATKARDEDSCFLMPSNEDWVPCWETCVSQAHNGLHERVIQDLWSLGGQTRGCSGS